jgi:uncharacterized membrane protein YkoI
MKFNFHRCIRAIVGDLTNLQLNDVRLVFQRTVMMHCKTILGAMLSAFLFTVVPAMSAQPDRQSLLAEHRYSLLATPEAITEQSKAKLLAFEQAKISLQDAISATESTLGGSVISAEFKISNGHPVYVVRTSVAWDKSVCQETIDARTARVIAEGRTIPDNRLDQRARVMLAGLHEWDASLGEAVAAAKDSHGGRPIGAHLMDRAGVAFFRVTLVKGASTINVIVDANDGRVVP